MDTTGTKTAAKIFGDQLSAFELLFAIELDGATPGERLNSLGALAKANPTLMDSLKTFLENPISFSKRFSSADNLFDSVAKTLFATAVRGAIHEYGSMGAPKRQHWMPVAYLNGFGTKTGTGKTNRSISVPGVSFADGLVMGFETRDSSFVHERVEGLGFYEDGAEFFFCLIENLYAQGRARQERTVDGGLVALFFFAQSVRNPRYGQRFLHSKLSAIVDAILANMDAVGPAMEVNFLKSAQQLPFTPYVPPFVDKLQGQRIYSLPISPNMLFTISTGPLDELSWKQIPKRYRESVIAQAVRRGSHIFGLQKVQILGTLQELARKK